MEMWLLEKIKVYKLIISESERNKLLEKKEDFLEILSAHFGSLVKNFRVLQKS